MGGSPYRFLRLSFGPVALTLRGEARRDAPGPWKCKFKWKWGRKHRKSEIKFSLVLFLKSAQRRAPGTPKLCTCCLMVFESPFGSTEEGGKAFPIKKEGGKTKKRRGKRPPKKKGGIPEEKEGENPMGSGNHTKTKEILSNRRQQTPRGRREAPPPWGGAEGAVVVFDLVRISFVWA